MITKLKYGNTNTYFVHGMGKGLLIDTDCAGTLPTFYKEIKKNNITINDITYVLATHYHPDHIGLIGELMEMGVKLLLFDTQTEHVHFADELFARDHRTDYKPIREKDAVVLRCEDSRDFFALNLGINGEIISTPSHSEDSIAVILDDGSCIVGDLEPIDYVDAYEDNPKLKSDWEHILSYHPKTIYYGHANEKRICLCFNLPGLEPLL